jgi:CrcB protein
MKLIFLAAGGAMGTILRYSLSGFTYKILGGVFPWGTLFVNLTGSLIIGLFWGFFEIQNLSSNVRNFLFIGVLGGFTTFSTLALESFNLLRNGELRLAISNLLASNVLGVILVFIGFLISKYTINFFK